jgi:transcriptional regulator with XRE-family HTH domain
MRLRLRVGATMRERKMSIAELAKAADIAPNTARALYRGVNERVDLVVLSKVAAALGVRPIELFEETEEQPGQKKPRRKAA